MSFLTQLSWRYATKKFDPAKKVRTQDLQKILEAIRMAPSSFGLQPYHISVIEDIALREELKEKGSGQPQITDASFLLVFSARTDVMERVNHYFDLLSGGDLSKRELVKSYEDMMKSFAAGLDENSAKAWAAKQAYIALGFGLAACAELSIDACPMEGFDPKVFKELLALPDTYYPQALMAVGYRAQDDTIRPKIRFPESDVFSKR